MRDIDTTEVKLRRRHKTVVRMFHRGSASTNSCDSETSSERLERQDAIEYTSGEDSRVYSGVKYKTGKSEPSWDGTEYESFIDHGEGAGEICYQRLHDSVSSFCFVTECESPTRESFMIGSTPVKCVDHKRQDSGENVIHLTTAKMNLLAIKQKSEQSANSSFEHKLSGDGWKNMACEDLLNIDDSIKIKNGNKQKPFQEKHHSMPVQFVGNRFNHTSMTEIYIPSCKGHSENAKLGTPCNSFEDEEHSNSVQIQERKMITIDAPDKLTAEILYNLEQFHECKSLPHEANPFVCDKRMSIDQGNSSNQPLPFPEPTELDFANKRFDSKFMPPATIYSSDSDSGMAGSYTLSPSDQFACHRSFISHKFNPHVTPSSIDYFAPQTISDPMHLNLSESREHMARYLHQNESLEGENRSNCIINFESSVKESPRNEVVYISGMYAHWWKKEKLPVEMLESIATTSAGESDKRDRGSGKQITLKIHFNDVALSCLFFIANFIIRPSIERRN